MPRRLAQAEGAGSVAVPSSCRRQGAEAAAAACLVLAFATLSWAAVHETVETVHTLPRAEAAEADARAAAALPPAPAPAAWDGPDVPPPEA